MRIGVPKEIKVHEYRVGMTPDAVREAVMHGHEVLVESEAGAGIGCDDAEYRNAGAHIVPDAETIYGSAELVVKVKEPQPGECAMLRQDQVLFTYLHLAPDPRQTELLQASGVTAIAYETVTDAEGGLPLLAPMSEVAGRMSIQVGATYLQKPWGRRGILLSGVPGAPAARVVVLGAGTAGAQAARTATGLGAQVTVFDRSLSKLRRLDELYGSRLSTVYSTTDAIEKAVARADLVIGAVLIPGATTPKLVRQKQLASMQPGAVLVDIAIDQGGCFETSHPTTHQEPVFELGGIIHYAVANMPGAVPRTSAFALNHATLPFVLALADKGWRQACREDPNLFAGLNVHQGNITCRAVAESLGKPYVPTSP
ncbi:MAG: alanine dehydrogenase [Betaproteobacteria bacterium]|nr:alanine dehydrogenase [Betaproteobacteria bacterium]MDE2622903.1 alanine dehydrogenase [Betaproteobacteria bacterium]